MRLEGVEPPRSCLHGDLNAARLPVPPQPRDRPVYRRSLATLRPANSPLSSRGLGRRPLTAETGVRIPVAVLDALLIDLQKCPQVDREPPKHRHGAERR